MNLQAALDLVEGFEGFRSKAYPDPVSGGAPWTIGYGSTTDLNGAPVTKDTPDVTPATASLIAMRDLQRFSARLDEAVKVPLTLNQRAALCSLGYNVGPGAAGHRDGILVLRDGSPSTLVRCLNGGDYAGAAKQILVWNRAGGHEVAGLTRRRVQEAKLFQA